MPSTRRHALATLAALGGASLADAFAQTPQAGAAPASKRLQVLMLVHPDMTALDLVGPQLVFATMGDVDTHMVWKDLSPVTTDSGLKLVPGMTFADAPKAPDILFVPGGLKGTTALLQDEETLRFLRERGASARWVTGVCTGVLLLGAAGLLRGYRATAHWYVQDILPVFDAEPSADRVVIDRNRVTGGAVTAGIDMALTMSAMLRGDDKARTQELAFGYAPMPPFAAGTPELAGEALTKRVLESRAPAISAARRAAEMARQRWAG
ncbi:DJ-1/PfpI family protein [Variovorax sp. E3]|uniref:DJ-1/PfpI family protein n=1 Tax=Variovorax sp. E3 TaxID=1914993 RepID=UPI0022B67BFA|nr:DJ-1/PfpI family protein [Variovorax sp. E3]